MAQPSHREQLLDGATKCLKAKGFARTTARDIASASGANLASIGYHFGSKDALLNEALIRLFEQRNRRVGRLARSAGDGTTRGFLSSTFAAATEVFKAPRNLFVSFLEAVAEAARTDDLRVPLATHYREARDRIAAALAASGDTERSAAMASLLLAIFDGLVIQWLLDPEETPAGADLFEALVEMVTADEADSAPASAGRS
jgi:AcrR family transcriptional regulator